MTLREKFEKVELIAIAFFFLFGSLAALLFCAVAYCITVNVWSALAIRQCLSKGHSMIYCDRALSGKSIILKEEDLDK